MTAIGEISGLEFIQAFDNHGYKHYQWSRVGPAVSLLPCSHYSSTLSLQATTSPAHS
jgi:hypothetical protein